MGRAPVGSLTGSDEGTLTAAFATITADHELRSDVPGIFESANVSQMIHTSHEEYVAYWSVPPFSAAPGDPEIGTNEGQICRNVAQHMVG